VVTVVAVAIVIAAGRNRFDDDVAAFVIRAIVVNATAGGGAGDAENAE